MSDRPLIIGIDGGGTKTVAWLTDVTDADAAHVLGRGTAGPSNLRTLGPETALANLDGAIAGAFAKAAIPRSTLAAICFALAGADRPAEQQTIRTWAEMHSIADHLSITNDADAVLAAANYTDEGIALISGTGSLAFGRCGDVHCRSGGWGPLFGDEGSGYWIALEGLRHAARAADGRETDPALLRRFLETLNLKQPSDLIATIYDPDFGRARIAALSRVVFDAAASSNQAAAAIVDAAARELAALVTSVRHQLPHNASPYPLALAGGNLCHQPMLVDRLTHHLTQNDAAPRSIAQVEFPVAGAVRLAARLAQQ